MSEEPTPSLEFTPIDHKWGFCDSSRKNDLLMKWNILPDLKIAKFKVSPRLPKTDYPQTIKALLSSPTLTSTLGISPPSESTLASLTLTQLNATILNMNFFDKLSSDDEIITASDVIRGCIDETYDGITIQDKLREMLINVDSENAGIYSEAEKNEFIYHLLSLVCVGGSMHQAEHYFAEYKNTTKELYKDLINVHKNSEGKIQITSVVYQVDPGGRMVFEKKNFNNKMYFVFDVNAGVATVIYKPFKSFW